MKLTDADLTQADAQVHWLLWEPETGLSGSLRVQTEGFSFRVRCEQCGKLEIPRVRYDEKRHEFVANCPACGTRWEKLPAYGYDVKGGPGGWDGGARVRGRTTGRDGAPRELPDQRVHCSPDRPHQGSSEHRMFGRAEIHKIHALKRIEDRLWHSHHRWPSRLYFLWVINEGSVSGRIGEFIQGARFRLQRGRSLEAQQAEREIDWSPTGVRSLIDSGRHEWAARLKQARLLYAEVRT